MHGSSHNSHCWIPVHPDHILFVLNRIPYSTWIWPWLTEFGPLSCQAKQTVSALGQLQSATLAGQILFTLAKFCYSTVHQVRNLYNSHHSTLISGKFLRGWRDKIRPKCVIRCSDDVLFSSRLDLLESSIFACCTFFCQIARNLNHESLLNKQKSEGF